MKAFKRSVLRKIVSILTLFMTVHFSLLKAQTAEEVSIKEIKRAIHENDSLWLNAMKNSDGVNIVMGKKTIESDIQQDEWNLSTNFYTRCSCLNDTEYSVFEEKDRLVISLYYLSNDRILNLYVTEMPVDMILYFDRKCRFKGLKKR